MKGSRETKGGAGEQPRRQPERHLDVAQAFDQKRLLLIGCTGFVGKVALSMLLYRYPNVGRLYVLVRPGAGNSPEGRFFSKVATSPVFDPLREMWGDGFESFLREKVRPIAGDIGRPFCNISEEQRAEFAADGGLDAIINSAGLVSFTPSLESGLRINTIGARHCLELARTTGAALVHVSTCFVAGKRDGEVWEDEPVVGYFPRKDELRDDDFDAEAEVADCQRLIDEVKAHAGDRAHVSEFRERATKSLEHQRRDPDDLATLRLAVARERKIWVHTKLTELGMQRAAHWGWTNTYTYTKSLGEQIILADREVRSTVVRPAIVESSVSYPMPGWNEGFNTTAPLVYLILKGHRQILAGDKTPLDIIPVDFIAAGLLAATAALLEGEHEPIYQLGSSDSNAVTTKRLTELTGLVVRRHYRQLADEGEDPTINRIRARLEAFPVSETRFRRFSAPSLKWAADRVSRAIDERLPSWGAPRLAAMAERAKDELQRVSEFTGQVSDLIDLFKPFTHDHHVVFRCDNIRRLMARLAPQDREFLRWAPDEIDWRSYWFDTHFPGLLEWVFPVLDDEFGKKPRTVYTYKDLLELFDAAAKLHRHRVAMRLVPEDGRAEPVVYTYERIQDMAEQGAASLRERGAEIGDRIMLMSENRPEWGISYFAILKAGCTAVPLDSQLSLAEVVNLMRSSGARAMLVSAKVADRILDDEGIELRSDDPVSALAAAIERAGGEAEVLRFEQVLAEPRVSPAAFEPPRKADQVASLIYTSGTTGEPKGVMLTHKNFTSMAAKLSSIFKLYRHDGLLSVLPLHHTFEFSAGFLMPLLHGAHITYLEEVSPESLGEVLEEGNITGLVGVPALWQLLHRKITQPAADRGPLVLRAFETVIELNRTLRERIPYGWNLGKILFFPVHRRFGGRMRLMISGGSALDPRVMKAMRGLGFHLYEGYGMTEASPVLAVQRPGEAPVVGSVGRALPGVDVSIADPDDRGVGEIIAKGPNVMKGYADNAEATSQMIVDGWLHTGDLGRLDEDGNVYIVGRKKEMILGPSGENVYPDELEELYRDSPYVRELSIVGIPQPGGGELVAALVVPEYDREGETREQVREQVREQIRQVSAKLPQYKRVKVVHLWDHELPRTSTRKVKRREVVRELERLERAAKSATAARSEKRDSEAGEGVWVRDVIAKVCQKPGSRVTDTARLADLGFDSLMITELGVALEAAGIELPDPSALAGLDTVGEVERYVAGHARKASGKPAPKKVERDVDVALKVPGPLAEFGRRGLRVGQRMLYERLLDAGVRGRAYVPPQGGFIVAANHASHLDMGLVKHALGDSGERLVALAAKDYFFDDPVRRVYFENFTNLVPMERHGSLRESLATASQVIRDGYILLIFPEGTRSEDGVMKEFKASLGYLATANRCGILPMYLAGTHDAMPKGSLVPKHRDVQAHIGPFFDYPKVAEIAQGVSRGEGYRRVAREVEREVRRLCPARFVWTLGEVGRGVSGETARVKDEDDKPRATASKGAAS
jgi:long-chain acyl-CoA synthetase